LGTGDRPLSFNIEEASILTEHNILVLAVLGVPVWDAAPNC
jgi:hypothetical protein